MNTSNEFEQAAAMRRVRSGQRVGEGTTSAQRILADVPLAALHRVDTERRQDSRARVVAGDVESRPMPIEYADGEPLTLGETLLLMAIGILCVCVVVGLVLAIAIR